MDVEVTNKHFFFLTDFFYSIIKQIIEILYLKHHYKKSIHSLDKLSGI